MTTSLLFRCEAVAPIFPEKSSSRDMESRTHDADGEAMRFTDRSFKLNNEQLHFLFNRLSSDEQREIKDALSECTNEMSLKRGLPFAALVMGSVYAARQKLPPQFHFGPKGWPFYTIIGVCSFTAANVLSMGNCQERIQPRLAELWKKYGANTSSSSYAALRQRNRGDAGNTEETRAALSRPVYQGTAADDDTYAPRLPKRQLSVYNDPAIAEDVPVMSGTPHSFAGRPPASSDSAKSSSYGDVDFS